VTVLIVTENKALLRQLRRELPELELLEGSASLSELQLGGSHPDLLLIHRPHSEHLDRLDDLLPKEIPIVLLEPSGNQSDSIPPGRGIASLSEPWSWEELRAVLMLAPRGGRYVDVETAGLENDLPETTDPGGRESREEPLSPREMEVLKKLAEGWTNRGIAGVLGISENTVKFHLSAIFRKLGAESRTEAIIVAAHRGLLAL
jgi:DNA-binding CsgD family transcriptional regulator